MRARNAAYAKNVLKRGQVSQSQEERRPASTQFALIFLLVIVVGSALFQLFNLA
ncbi:hypothetical protein BDF22DRAFT_744465 [Syncephalis plumigaleata]|nr:hypothetical protein BDF22DRAFT_744465 [Syncephalis plumigaleata]